MAKAIIKAEKANLEGKGDLFWRVW